MMRKNSKNPKMRFGAPVAKAAKGGFLGGMAEGMAAGAKVGKDAKDAKKAAKDAKGETSVYRRGGLVKGKK